LIVVTITLHLCLPTDQVNYKPLPRPLHRHGNRSRRFAADLSLCYQDEDLDDAVEIGEPSIVEGELKLIATWRGSQWLSNTASTVDLPNNRVTARSPPLATGGSARSLSLSDGDHPAGHARQARVTCEWEPCRPGPVGRRRATSEASAAQGRTRHPLVLQRYFEYKTASLSGSRYS